MKTRCFEPAAFLFAVLCLCGFGEARHARVEASAKANEDKSVTMTFKVVPNDDMQLATEGGPATAPPWSLTLSQTEGLGLKEKDGTWITKAFDKTIPGFEVKTEPSSAKGKGAVKYKVRSFICTKDKTRCYPELHEGTLAWAATK